MAFKARFLGKAVFGLLAVAVLGAAVMTLWNAVMPGLLAGAHPVDYLHALGLLVLCRILIGGFRGHGGWHRRCRHQRGQALTADERAQFKQRESRAQRHGADQA